MKLFSSKKETMTADELKARIIARTEQNNELRREIRVNAGEISWMFEAMDAHTDRKYKVTIK
jgi:hypothetical protein